MGNKKSHNVWTNCFSRVVQASRHPKAGSSRNPILSPPSGEQTKKGHVRLLGPKRKHFKKQSSLSGDLAMSPAFSQAEQLKMQDSIRKPITVTG